MNFDLSFVDLDTKILLGFGNEEIGVNSRYLTKQGKPWLPIMGEIHFSRVPEQEWLRELLKMKAGGIGIISSYIIWNHHEGIEGKCDWSSNKNLRKFITLCQDNGLYFFLRLGPWVHGECRYGGFPDWLVEQCGDRLRCNDDKYLSYVERFFAEISKQVTGLSNIIGIQVENELVDYPEHLIKIKEIVIKTGMNAPIFTATGWGENPKVPTETLLPMYGKYPEAPWEQHTKRLAPNVHYFFCHERNDSIIGNDLAPKNQIMKNREKDTPKTPFITCEVGGGNQVTYHRRPIISDKDIVGLGITIIGSGCNLLGYYMYHGGQNPANETTNLQESRDTGYPNDYPIVSYDFQSPLGEYGQYRQSYYHMKHFHCFLESYGQMLATMVSVLPKEQPKNFEDKETLRCAVRTDGTKGFLFVNQHERLETLSVHKDVSIHLQLASSKITLKIPQITSDVQFILPFNLSIGGEHLIYALAQPVDIKENVYSFLAIDGVEPRFVFENREFVLTDEEVAVGTEKIRLVKPEEYTITKGDILEVCKVENRISFERFTYLNLTDQTQEWEVKWDEKHRYLKIDCVGNVAQAYCAGELISDWFCNGTPWIIDVKNLKEQKLIIKVQPLTEQDDVYFEVSMAYGIYPPKVEGILDTEIFV